MKQMTFVVRKEAMTLPETHHENARRGIALEEMCHDRLIAYLVGASLWEHDQDRTGTNQGRM